jgi:ABC-2 type transport system ATP-binding protein
VADSIIETSGLTRRFGHFVAVDAISFDVAKGEVFGFLGANGAGKTTAIRMLTGLLAPSDGRATVAGFDVATQSEQIKRNIGYMSQRFSLYDDLTVRENIRLYGGIYDLSPATIDDRMQEILGRLGLSDMERTLVRALPLGWKQKLVFLDEPTSGVDPITRRQFWEMIYDTAHSGTTVLVSTHYMDEAEYCDRLLMMVAGKVAASGTPADLKKQYGVDSIDELFVRLARSANGAVAGLPA